MSNTFYRSAAGCRSADNNRMAQIYVGGLSELAPVV